MHAMGWIQVSFSLGVQLTLQTCQFSKNDNKCQYTPHWLQQPCWCSRTTCLLFNCCCWRTVSAPPRTRYDRPQKCANSALLDVGMQALWLLPSIWTVEAAACRIYIVLCFQVRDADISRQTSCHQPPTVHSTSPVNTKSDGTSFVVWEKTT